MLIICAVKDSATEAYGQPFFVKAVGQAVRSFLDEINRQDEQNTLYKHPDDYELYTIGVYNEETGEISPHKPERIAQGKAMKTVYQNGPAHGTRMEGIQQSGM